MKCGRSFRRVGVSDRHLIFRLTRSFARVARGLRPCTPARVPFCSCRTGFRDVLLLSRAFRTWCIKFDGWRERDGRHMSPGAPAVWRARRCRVSLPKWNWRVWQLNIAVAALECPGGAGASGARERDSGLAALECPGGAGASGARERDSGLAALECPGGAGASGARERDSGLAALEAEELARRAQWSCNWRCRTRLAGAFGARERDSVPAALRAGASGARKEIAA